MRGKRSSESPVAPDIRGGTETGTHIVSFQLQARQAFQAERGMKAGLGSAGHIRGWRMESVSQSQEIQSHLLRK